MLAKVQAWGNSQGIRIPKIILEEAGIRIDDEVDLFSQDKKIVLQKIERKKHTTLQERIEAYYGKPISSIKSIDQGDEYDWGKPEGEEVW